MGTASPLVHRRVRKTKIGKQKSSIMFVERDNTLLLKRIKKPVINFIEKNEYLKREGPVKISIILKETGKIP